MGLKFVLSISAITFSLFSKCQAWIPQYNTVFEPGGFINTVLDPVTFPYTPSYGLQYQSSSFHQENPLVLEKIFENQLIAYSLIFSLESSFPCELRYTTSSCNKGIPKELFFSDYPHVKALTQHQWKRLRNFLQEQKLGSLRINSPFYRP